MPTPRNPSPSRKSAARSWPPSLAAPIELAIDAGVRWRQVIDQAAKHGLAPLNGSSSGVGAVSYTLGGGLSPVGRTFGYSADHVRRIEIVTADGKLRHVTPENNADLLWALRGGKGNFGVVTSIEVDLLPVPRLYGGGLYFAGEGAAEICTPGWTGRGQCPRR